MQRIKTKQNLQKSLIYLDDNSTIIEQYWNTGERTWGSSVLSTLYLVADPSSRLASYTLPGFTQYPAFVIYQDSSRALIAAKSPLPNGDLNWSTSILDTLGDSQLGTGLALVPFGQTEDKIDEVRLFFQRPNGGNLTVASWDQNNDWKIRKTPFEFQYNASPIYVIKLSSERILSSF
jgi:hypothetical protein